MENILNADNSSPRTPDPDAFVEQGAIKPIKESIESFFKLSKYWIGTI